MQNRPIHSLISVQVQKEWTPICNFDSSSVAFLDFLAHDVLLLLLL
jgi:hypothetical protein